MNKQTIITILLTLVAPDFVNASPCLIRISFNLKKDQKNRPHIPKMMISSPHASVSSVPSTWHFTCACPAIATRANWIVMMICFIFISIYFSRSNNLANFSRLRGSASASRMVPSRSMSLYVGKAFTFRYCSTAFCCSSGRL